MAVITYHLLTISTCLWVSYCIEIRLIKYHSHLTNSITGVVLILPKSEKSQKWHFTTYDLAWSAIFGCLQRGCLIGFTHVNKKSETCVEWITHDTESFTLFRERNKKNNLIKTKAPCKPGTLLLTVRFVLKVVQKWATSSFVTRCSPGSQKVKDLPGVGWSLEHKLQTLGVKTCSELQKFSSQALQREFGPKTGLVLHQYCRGIDDRALRTERERKSVSAEINYGIRFTKVRWIVFLENNLDKLHEMSEKFSEARAS